MALACVVVLTRLPPIANSFECNEKERGGSGVATYGALGHVLPSSFGNSVHSAASLELKCKDFENFQRKTCIKFSSINLVRNTLKLT